MGRLTQAEATDLHVESLREDKRKLTAEVARLGAEVVQLKHRLAERIDVETERLRAESAGLERMVFDLQHERSALKLRLGAMHDEREQLQTVAAERERLLAEGVAIVEGLWAELARLRGRAELPEEQLKAFKAAKSLDISVED